MIKSFFQSKNAKLRSAHIPKSESHPGSEGNKVRNNPSFNELTIRMTAVSATK